MNHQEELDLYFTGCKAYDNEDIVKKMGGLPIIFPKPLSVWIEKVKKQDEKPIQMLKYIEESLEEARNSNLPKNQKQKEIIYWNSQIEKQLNKINNPKKSKEKLFVEKYLV